MSSLRKVSQGRQFPSANGYSVQGFQTGSSYGSRRQSYLCLEFRLRELFSFQLLLRKNDSVSFICARKLDFDAVQME